MSMVVFLKVLAAGGLSTFFEASVEEGYTLARGKATSWRYLEDILGISWDILGISWRYLVDILEISWGYLDGDILGISPRSAEESFTLLSKRQSNLRRSRRRLLLLFVWLSYC